jgi:hypothetical protein
MRAPLGLLALPPGLCIVIVIIVVIIVVVDIIVALVYERSF